jgi:hypothetical protein
VDEVPDRSVVDLETATGEFRDKTSQRKRFVPSDVVAQKHRMSVSDRLRLVSAHFAPAQGCRFRHPINHRARRDTELSRRPMTGQPALHNQPHNPREDPSNKASHSDRPTAPVAMLNHNKSDSGIACRFRLMSSRSKSEMPSRAHAKRFRLTIEVAVTDQGSAGGRRQESHALRGRSRRFLLLGSCPLITPAVHRDHLPRPVRYRDPRSPCGAAYRASCQGRPIPMGPLTALSPLARSPPPRRGEPVRSPRAPDRRTPANPGDCRRSDRTLRGRSRLPRRHRDSARVSLT